MLTKEVEARQGAQGVALTRETLYQDMNRRADGGLATSKKTSYFGQS